MFVLDVLAKTRNSYFKVPFKVTICRHSAVFISNVYIEFEFKAEYFASIINPRHHQTIQSSLSVASFTKAYVASFSLLVKLFLSNYAPRFVMTWDNSIRSWIGTRDIFAWQFDSHWSCIFESYNETYLLRLYNAI